MLDIIQSGNIHVGICYADQIQPNAAHDLRRIVDVFSYSFYGIHYAYAYFQINDNQYVLIKVITIVDFVMVPHVVSCRLDRSIQNILKIYMCDMLILSYSLSHYWRRRCPKFLRVCVCIRIYSQPAWAILLAIARPERKCYM